MAARENELILNQYKKVVDMIGLFLGNSVEVVLHSLVDLERSVIHIHNGQKTLRRLGSPVTDKALKILDEYKSSRSTLIGPYKTVSRDGHIMKSVTTVIVNSKEEAIGMLCINFDLSTPMSDIFKILFEGFSVETDENQEHFATDIQDLLGTTVNQIRRQVMEDESIPQRQKNKMIVHEIQRQGLFNLRNAVPVISEILELSKDAIYLHLRSFKQEREKAEAEHARAHARALVSHKSDDEEVEQE